MNQRSTPAPRRILLGGLVLLALGLRLWGIGWRPAASEELAALEVIHRIATCGPGCAGAVGEAFFLLVAGWNWVVGVGAWVWGWLLGAGSGAETVVGVVTGRVVVAVGGAAAVGMCWAVGRRWFSSIGVGALAATMLATSPLLVGLGHILNPAGMAPLAWAWAAGMGWVLAARVGAKECFWAGVCTGLVASGLEGGVLAGVSTWWGYWAGVRLVRPGRMKAWVLWPLVGLGGVAVGVGLGAPGVVLKPMEAARHLAGLWQGWAAALEETPHRALECWKCVLWGGPGVVWALGAVGTGLMARAKDWTRLGLAVGAGVGLVGAVVGPWEPRGIVAGASVLAAMVGAWPVVLACRRAGAYRAQIAAAAAAGVVICMAGLYISLATAQGFWRPTTWEVAGEWIERNLPEGAELWLGKGVPSRAVVLGRPVSARPPVKGFLLELAPGTHPERVVLRRFHSLGQWLGAMPWFPEGFSPPLVLYGPSPATHILEPLSLPRLTSASWERWRAIDPQGCYGKDEGVMWFDSPGAKTRALTVVPPGVVGVELAGAGEEYSQLVLCEGPWCTRQTGLYPGQQRVILLGPKQWPPLPGALVPVEVQVRSGGQVWARVMTNPLAIASAAARLGLWKEVVRVLGPVVERGEGGLEARVLMGLGLVRLGRTNEASKVLGPVAIAGPPGCFRLGASWKQAAESCGYEPGLLRSATGLTCNIRGPLCISEGRPVPLRGRGWHGLYTRQGPLGHGQLRISLDDPLPAGTLEILAEFSSAEPDGKDLGRINVWLEGMGQRRKAATGKIVAKAGGNWQERFVLPVGLPGSKLRMVLHYLGGELKLKRLWIGPAMQAHIKKVLARYYEATGLVQLAAHRLKRAIASLSRALELNPGSWQLGVALTEALAESGELARAQSWARRAKDMVWDFPEGLKRLAAVCKRLKLTPLSQQLATRMAYLRPSLKHEAAFACGLKLLGYDLPATKVRRGSQLKVTYYWQATGRIPTNYFIFVHLRGPSRTLNFDHLLAGGKVSMNTLVPGQVVRESYKLSIPRSTPPGKYRLVVGLWDARFTGKKVNITSGQEAGLTQVDLGEIEVLP